MNDAILRHRYAAVHSGEPAPHQTVLIQAYDGHVGHGIERDGD
jgi:hypothetical protein